MFLDIPRSFAMQIKAAHTLSIQIQSIRTHTMNAFTFYMYYSAGVQRKRTLRQKELAKVCVSSVFSRCLAHYVIRVQLQVCSTEVGIEWFLQENCFNIFVGGRRPTSKNPRLLHKTFHPLI